MKKLNYLPFKILFCLIISVLVLSSCKKSASKTPYRVLILGNSITWHPAKPEIGWFGDWGMAASAADKDFVHLLKKKFEKVNPSVKVDYKNINEFETGYWQYDLSKLDSLKNLKPNLIILRIGEGVNPGTVEEHEFKGYYRSLIQYFRASNPTSKVICAAGFWKNEPVENIIKSVSAENNFPYIELSSLDNVEYMAWNEFSDAGVRTHPSDKGMQAIADLIWEQVVKLL